MAGYINNWQSRSKSSVSGFSRVWHKLRNIISTIGLMMAISEGAKAGFFDEKPKFLPLEQAFILQSLQTSTVHGTSLDINVQIADGYWIYANSVEIASDKAQLGEFSLPSGEEHKDPYQGKTKVYFKALKFKLPILQAQEQGVVKLTFQGCTDGFCYPPTTETIPLEPVLNSGAGNQTNSLNSVSSSPQAEPIPMDLTYELGDNLWQTLWFFVLGIGLAFTPCVLPMLPLLSSLVIGTENRPSPMKSLGLSIVYVQGMALTYTLLGLAVASIGLEFQLALQSPAILIGLSIIFTILALSMFGLFTLQLPLSLQNKLMQISQKQSSGKLWGVFVMGVVAGLVASPCTSAPLSGALLYVAQSGDLLIGGLSLYLLALGMGVPLILITVFGNQILPKSGEWLNIVKASFGFVMLAVPIFLIARLIPESVEMALWSLLATSFCAWLFLQISMVKLIYRLALLILALISVQPLQNLVWQGLGYSNNVANLNQTTSQLPWQKARTLEELKQLLANNPKAFAMVDFYADWCVACKELDKYTFSDPKVQEALANALLIKVDLTQDTEENQKIYAQWQILGLPAVLFFDQQGQELKNTRIAGFVEAEEFLQLLEKVNSKINP